MQVKSIAECSRGAFCSTFDLHYGFKTYVLSIFDWLLILERFHCLSLFVKSERARKKFFIFM